MNGLPSQPPQVLYTLPIKKLRILIPKVITLMILTVLFYLGILLNLNLLKLTGDVETTVKTSALGVLALLIIIGSLHAYKNASKPYKFYASHISHGKDNLTLSDIVAVKKKQNFDDKIFGTYTIRLTKKFSIDAIPKSIDLVNYITQLVDYNKRQQGRQQAY